MPRTGAGDTSAAKMIEIGTRVVMNRWRSVRSSTAAPTRPLSRMAVSTVDHAFALRRSVSMPTGAKAAREAGDLSRRHRTAKARKASEFLSETRGIPPTAAAGSHGSHEVAATSGSFASTRIGLSGDGAAGTTTLTGAIAAMAQMRFGVSRTAATLPCFNETASVGGTRCPDTSPRARLRLWKVSKSLRRL